MKSGASRWAFVASWPRSWLGFQLFGPRKPRECFLTDKDLMHPDAPWCNPIIIGGVEMSRWGRKLATSGPFPRRKTGSNSLPDHVQGLLTHFLFSNLLCAFQQQHLSKMDLVSGWSDRLWPAKNVACYSKLSICDKIGQLQGLHSQTDSWYVIIGACQFCCHMSQKAH